MKRIGTSMNAAWVTVIIPTKGRPAILAEAVQSVRCQSCPDWECVVAIDGHDPETQRYVSSVISEDSRFRMLVVENGGMAARVRNAALDCVTTPFLAFLDDDDVWLAPKLTTQKAVFAEHPRAILSCGRIEEFGDRAGTWPSGAVPSVLDANLLCEGNRVATSTVVARTWAIHEAGGFDAHQVVAEDYDLWLRMTAIGELRFSDATLCRYRVHVGNSSRHQLRMLEEEENVLRRRFPDGLFSRKVYRKRMRRIRRERAKRTVPRPASLITRLKRWLRMCGLVFAVSTSSHTNPRSTHASSDPKK